MKERDTREKTTFTHSRYTSVFGVCVCVSVCVCVCASGIPYIIPTSILILVIFELVGTFLVPMRKLSYRMIINCTEFYLFIFLIV